MLPILHFEFDAIIFLAGIGKVFPVHDGFLYKVAPFSVYNIHIVRFVMPSRVITRRATIRSTLRAEQLLDKPLGKIEKDED